MILRTTRIKLLICFSLLFTALQTDAASLQISPSTGVYQIGSVFTVKVLVNTDGKAVNAAEGTMTYNVGELSVVSVERSSSIFNLWVTEPAFSNTAGTLTFSGGVPSGYTGKSGTVFNVTFKVKAAGTGRVSFKGGAVLANDGMGTNVLANMGGGTYTLVAQSDQPQAEEIEYVAPANTPKVPIITSTTNPKSGDWSQVKSAELSWSLPDDVIAVRTALDQSPTTVPTKLYETPISKISLPDLPEGRNYFHLQFKNAEGWGKVAHYAIFVDSIKPAQFTIELSEGADLSSSMQELKLLASDETTDIKRYLVKIDNNEPYEYLDEKITKKIALPSLTPGYHSFVIEAYDEAGNSLVSTFSFTLLAFDKPVFTEFPNEINEEVIPVLKGKTRSNATVLVSFGKIGTEYSEYNVKSDGKGEFTFIPESTLSQGVYEVTARATDQFGAQSELSDPIRIAVQQPGYVQIGSKLVSFLSIIIPLLAMAMVLALMLFALVYYLRRFRRKVFVESEEAVSILEREFNLINDQIVASESNLTEAKKTKKLNEAEMESFANIRKAISQAEQKIKKEIIDVERLVKK